MNQIKYPDICVKLTDTDGQYIGLRTSHVLAKVSRALRRRDVPRKEVAAFQTEATSREGCDHLLQTCQQWVNVI